MNFKQIFHQLALLLLVLSSLLLVTAGWSGIQFLLGDATERVAMQSLGFAALIGALVATLLWVITHKVQGSIGRREAMLLVTLSWLVGAALSALPYYIWAISYEETGSSHPFGDYVNCYFESMSGLTTTGATTLSEIESLPRGILLWRALTHWFGGLGIVVLFVAVLPSLGVGGKKLYRVESPGPTPDGFSPQIRETARFLWYIYMGLTIAEMVALWLAGMNWFDSACHTFATLATGGFSTKNASVGAYNSISIDIIVIVFMFIAGMNFGLLYHLCNRRFTRVWKDTELRMYAFLMFGGAFIVILSLCTQNIKLTNGEQLDPSVADAVRQGLFTTTSIQTTTGFCTSDYNQWPDVAKIVLIGLMFVGGCAGSTGGGIKVIRVWIALKVIVAELEKAFRPRVMRPVKVGGTPLEEEQKMETLVFVITVFLIFAVGLVTIMLFESMHGGCDFATASSASVATLCTIGPGLARVGAVENYGWFSTESKWVLSLLMVIGRLEVYAILVLFTPRFWRGD